MLNFNKLRFIIFEIFDNSQLFLTDPRKGSFYIKGCDKACPQLSLLSTIFVFRADPSSEMAALASN